MSAKRLHNLANYIMVGAPIYSYAAITEQEYWIVALVAVVAFAAYYKDYLGVFALKGVPYKIAMLIGLGYGIVDIYGRDTSLFIIAVANMLIIVQFIGLLQKHTRSSYRLMVLISLVHLATCSALTTELFFAVVFFVFAMSATLSLMLRLIVECTETADSVQAAKAGRPGMGFMTLSFIVTIITMLLAACIFTVFPRVAPGFIARRPASASTTAVSGFSDSIKLDDIGQILENKTPVMYVALEKDGLPYKPSDVLDLNWRGLALAHFNGTGWSRSADSEIFDSEQSSRSITFPIPANPESADRTPDGLIKQDIIMEPFDLAIVFGLDFPLYGRIKAGDARLIGAENKKILRNFYDHSLSYDDSGFTSKINYVIYSAIPRHSRDMLMRDTALKISDLRRPSHLNKSYLRECLDKTHISQKLKKLADEIAPKKEKLKTYEIVERIRKYFSESGDYEYTLDINMVDVESPIDAFVFEKKAGHCELYASAMALLIRCHGIPARIVNGFKGGSWDKVNKRYVIAQHHAHAWVEVRFKNAGWVPFDGVPASSSHYEATRAEITWMQGMLLWARLAWTRHVVGFDKKAQSDLYKKFKETQKGLAKTLDKMFSHNRNLIKALFTGNRMSLKDLNTGSITVLVFSALIILVGMLAVMTVLKRLRPQSAYAKPGKGAYGKTAIHIIRLYHGKLRVLKRRGIERSPNQTANELAETSLRRGAVRPEINEFTEIFCRARYGASVKQEDYVRARDLSRLITL